MKHIQCYLILLSICSTVLSCDPKNKDNAEKQSQSGTAPTKSSTHLKSGNGPPTDSNGTLELAMNRNEAIRERLTQPKPDWLTLGAPVETKFLPDEKDGMNWVNIGDSKINYTAGQTATSVGSLPLPPNLSGKDWSSATISLDGSRVLMIPRDMTEAGSLFQVAENKVAESTQEEVPIVNYDDERRWFIQWDGWISDSKIVGIFNEEDPSGHSIVRSGIYLYDVDSRELSPVVLPAGLNPPREDYLEIFSASPEGMELNTANGKFPIAFEN